MRIVLDTNAVISALLWRGTPYRLLETIHRQAGSQFYSSSALLEELADVVSRPAFITRLAAIGKTAPQILTDYLALKRLQREASAVAIKRVLAWQIENAMVGRELKLELV